MRAPSLTAFVVLFTAGIWTPARAQAPAPIDLAVEQIAFIAMSQCLGACDESSPPTYEPVLMDPDGSHVIPFRLGAWSPDGTRLLLLSEVGNDILVMPAAGGTSTNLTNHPAYDWTPAWSPNGTRIAFASDRDGPLDLYVMNTDGSDVMRIGTGVGRAWGPTWSPNGARLAFTCIVDPVPPTNLDICAINADGSGFARLTSEPGSDSDPDWSPDGSRILFTTDRYGTELVVMKPDGSDVTRVSPGIPGVTPRWSSDGTRIAFVYLLPFDWDAPWMPWQFVFVMNADGTGLIDLGWGYGPTWRPSSGGPNDRPVASFTFECSGPTCTFDGSPSSDSDGTIASYGWHFGDGTDAWGATVTHTFTGGHDVRLIVVDDDGALATSTRNVNQLPVVSFTTTCTGLTCTFDGSASSDPDGYLWYFYWGFGDWTERSGYVKAVTHTYAAPGRYTVSLMVWDSESVTASRSQTVTVGNVNVQPIAFFGYTCSGLTCNFNASGSSDPDGTIVSYAWTFGDGTTGSGATVSRTYAAGGTYTVRLTVTDNGGAMGSPVQSVIAVPFVTPPPPSTNLARNKTAVASSVESSPYLAANAVDGTTSTRWSSQFSDSQWIYVDLERPYDIDRVVLRWETAYGADYEVQASNDAATWMTIRSVTNGDGGTDDLTGVSQTGRYVRILGARRGTPWGYSLWELEVYGTVATSPPPPANLALNRPATASSLEGAPYSAANAFDGNSSTRWSSVFSDPQSITVDLGETVHVTDVTLRWETAFAADYQIQISNDGIAWTTIRSVTNGDGGVDDLTGLSGTGRYVRMSGTRRSTPWGYSLWELEVYGTPASSSPPTQPTDVVIHASAIPDAGLHGSWRRASDPTAADRSSVVTPDDGWASVDAPLAMPVDYIEATFSTTVTANFHLWLRLRAQSETKWNDSVWVQLSDATVGGTDTYQIGTTSGLLVNLEQCGGCGVAGWGWKDSAWWLGQSAVVTLPAGLHTIRIQVREDGVQLDQIVLSPQTYMTQAPGAANNDATIRAALR